MYVLRMGMNYPQCNDLMSLVDVSRWEIEFGDDAWRSQSRQRVIQKKS